MLKKEVNLKRVCLQWANLEMNWPLCYTTEEPPKKLKEGVLVPVYQKKNYNKKKRKGSPAPPPPKDIRKDGAEHWPKVGGSLRCKFPKCKGYSTISCNKCGVNLCLSKNNNCFLNYHKK